MSAEFLKASLGVLITPEPDTKVWLLKRSKNEDWNLIGKWQLPGGVLETGEDPKSAFMREIREETGLLSPEISNSTIILQLFENKPVYQFYIYLCLLTPESVANLKLGDDESDELQAFSRQELLNIDLFPVTKAALDYFGLV